MPEAMVQTILFGISFLKQRDRRQRPRAIVRVKTRLPVGDRRPDFRFGAPKLAFPARGIVGGVFLQIPLPHPNIRTFRGQFEPLPTLAQLGLYLPLLSQLSRQPAVGGNQILRLLRHSQLQTTIGGTKCVLGFTPLRQQVGCPPNHDGTQGTTEHHRRHIDTGRRQPQSSGK